MAFEKNKRAETIIYIVLWTMLFMAPVMSMSVRSAQTGIDFDWSEIFTVWKQYAVFFLVFLIHNHLMAPMLIYHQQKWRYLGLSVAIIVIFQVYQCNHRPDFRNRGPRPEMVKQFEHERPPLPPDFQEGDFEPGFQEGDFEPGEPPRDIEPFRPDGPRHEKGSRHEKGPRREGNQHPPLIFGQRDIVALIIVVLMLGMNLGIKLYFKQRNDQKHLKELERRNLEQQLEYLKYQINLQNYITLMKLRYTDKVRIQVDVAQTLPNKDVPPLIFITFVENAFKHGVSYRQESFIDIAINIDNDTLVFTCNNSRIPQEEEKHGGVGLANVRQRLDLIYGLNYELDINDDPQTYSVKLTLPL